jgi:hypothetical protein
MVNTYFGSTCSTCQNNDSFLTQDEITKISDRISKKVSKEISRQIKKSISSHSAELEK